MERKEWGRAEAILSHVLDASRNEPQLDDLRARSAVLLEQARHGLADQETREKDRARYVRFCQLRDEALFRDTDFTGLDLPGDLEATRRTARDALSVFVNREYGGGWTPAPIPASFSSQEQAEVFEGCYELLLIWAEAVARPLPPTEEGRPQAGEALQILELTAKLLPSFRPTRLPLAPGGVPRHSGRLGGGPEGTDGG